jgi:hypothetical protein
MVKHLAICGWRNCWFWDCCCQHYSCYPTGIIVSSLIWNQIKLIIVTVCKTHFKLVRGWYFVHTWAETMSMLSVVYYGFSQVLSRQMFSQYLKLGHDSFLPNSFQFIISYLSCHWLIHVYPELQTAQLNRQQIDKWNSILHLKQQFIITHQHTSLLGIWKLDQCIIEQHLS